MGDIQKRPPQRGISFERPFFIRIWFVNYRRETVYFILAFGYHRYVDMFAKGFEFIFVHPQRYKDKDEGERFNGIFKKFFIKRLDILNKPQ